MEQMELCTETNSRIRIQLALLFIQAKLTQPEYKLLRDFLECESTAPPTRTIHTPLIQEILTCLPQNSTSIHFYQLWNLAAQVLPDLTVTEQENLTLQLSQSQDMKARLIIAFANYHIPRYLLSTNARESSSSTGFVQPTEQKLTINQTLRSRLAMLSEKVSRTS